MTEENFILKRLTIPSKTQEMNDMKKKLKRGEKTHTTTMKQQETNIAC